MFHPMYYAVADKLRLVLNFEGLLCVLIMITQEIQKVFLSKFRFTYTDMPASTVTIYAGYPSLWSQTTLWSIHFWGYCSAGWSGFLYFLFFILMVSGSKRTLTKYICIPACGVVLMGNAIRVAWWGIDYLFRCQQTMFCKNPANMASTTTYNTAFLTVLILELVILGLGAILTVSLFVMVQETTKVMKLEEFNGAVPTHKLMSQTEEEDLTNEVETGDGDELDTDPLIDSQISKNSKRNLEKKSQRPDRTFFLPSQYARADSVVLNILIIYLLDFVIIVAWVLQDIYKWKIRWTDQYFTVADVPAYKDLDSTTWFTVTFIDFWWWVMYTSSWTIYIYVISSLANVSGHKRKPSYPLRFIAFAFGAALSVSRIGLLAWAWIDCEFKAFCKNTPFISGVIHKSIDFTTILIAEAVIFLFAFFIFFALEQLRFPSEELRQLEKENGAIQVD